MQVHLSAQDTQARVCSSNSKLQAYMVSRSQQLSLASILFTGKDDCRRTGNTSIMYINYVWSSVHPRAYWEYIRFYSDRARTIGSSRVCGEHIFGVVAELCVYGSSPRVRGTRNMLYKFIRSVRFIPACAGNTWYTLAGFVCQWPKLLTPYWPLILTPK